MRRLGAAFFLLFLIGCMSDLVTIRREKGTTSFDDEGRVDSVKKEVVEVCLPPNTQDPSTFSVTDSGVDANVAPFYPLPEEDTSGEATAKGGVFLAALFGAGSIVLLALHFKTGIVPLIAPIACAGLAIVFFSMPSIVDKHPLMVWGTVVATMAWAGYEAWHQKRLKDQAPTHLKKAEHTVTLHTPTLGGKDEHT